jgi:hypothetical protein
VLGGLTAWGDGRTTSLCTVGGLAVWTRDRTSNLCSGPGLTIRECDLTASCGNPRGTRGDDNDADMGAASEASSYRKMSKSLVRRGDIVKGKTAS